MSSNFASDYGSLASAPVSTYSPVTARLTGSDALKPRDIQAICRYLNLPIPTPDVKFDDILMMSGLTREDVYVRLGRSTSIDVMIAAAALRSGVTRVADDKRLAPAPHAKAPRAERTPRSTTGEKSPRSPDLDDLNGNAVIETIAPCPSKPGSERERRYSLYQVGMTISAVVEAGVRTKDIRRHIADGSITVRQP